MDFNEIALNILVDPLEQVYNIICRKPFLIVKVQSEPQHDKLGEASVTFTIVNESNHDMEVRHIWFLTSYNRPITSELLDSKVPLKMSIDDRVTYSVPVKELKPTLNKSAGDTITEVLVSDQTGRNYSGRLSKAVRAELSK